jgi:LmbE family N-acetylglucosaminyl deacetylase
MRWIYLSPHLDDAVFSAGGLIYEKVHAGQQVEIWTIVCGYPPPGKLTPLAELLHRQWGTGSAEETVRLRREEDARATRFLGAASIYLDVPDCIYRRGIDGEALYQDIFVPPHPFEADLPERIADSLSRLLQPDDQVICEFALGGHVDHILVRQAAERLNRPLWYAADLPYHFKQPDKLEPMIAGMKVFRQSLSEAALGAWLEGTLMYKSQLSSVFEDLEQIDPNIRVFCQEWSGFPLWQKV